MQDGLYDPTTELPNVHLFTDRLRVDLARSIRSGEGLAVVSILLDAAWGGSELKGVVGASARLRSIVRADETAAHVGPSEFALILTGLSNAQQIVTRTQGILDALHKREAGWQGTAASIGVAIFPRDIAVSDDLWSAARLAAKTAKDNGGDSVRYYSPEMEHKSALRIHIESRLRGALRRNELGLDYQPIYSLGSGMVCGAEALLRWTDAEAGAIPPDQFIPVAEETNVILGLGSWVMRRACAMLRERSRLGYADIPISVNVSARQFEEQDVPDLVRQALDESGVHPSLLHLEITEALIAREGAKALHTLQALRELGVKIAIDDFGTGPTCLRDMKSLPVDYLKIDSCFIRSMREDHRDQAVVESIVRMGDRMGFRMVAEGVEHEREATLLRELGCHEAQGYYFKRPMPEEEFASLVPAPMGRRSASGRPLSVGGPALMRAG